MKSNKHRLLRVPDLKFPLSWRARPIWWAETLWCRSVDWNKSNTPAPSSVRQHNSIFLPSHICFPLILDLARVVPQQILPPLRLRIRGTFPGDRTRFVVWSVHCSRLIYDWNCDKKASNLQCQPPWVFSFQLLHLSFCPFCWCTGVFYWSGTGPAQPDKMTKYTGPAQGRVFKDQIQFIIN